MAEFNSDGSVDHIAFVYPTGGGMQSIQVRESDIRRLNPNQPVSTDKYLSDTGIDFIQKHIVAGISHQTQIRYNPFVASVLFFTHLKSTLMSCGGDSSQFSTTWYAGFIHDHPMILAINHGSAHFTGTAIWNPWGVEPIVYHYDPLPGYHSRSYIFPPYKAYLCSAAHRPFLAQQQQKVVPKPKFVQLRGPIQPNSWDCALYALYFVQYSLSLPASAQTENPYEHFNETTWVHEDIVNMRQKYYDIMLRLKGDYEAFRDEQIRQYNESGDRDDSSGSATPLVLEPQQQPQPEQYVDGVEDLANNAGMDQKYREDLLYEAFLIQKFGSMESYLQKIPCARDQKKLRNTFDGKLDLLTFWESKKSGINCGYVGENKMDLHIYTKFVFESSLLWAPPNSHGYDICPFDPNRYPSLYGYQSFAVMEVNGKHYLCGYALYCPEYGHKYMLWVNNLTCCWNPRREYIIYNTEKEAFTFVQGKYFSTGYFTLRYNYICS